MGPTNQGFKWLGLLCRECRSHFSKRSSPFEARFIIRNADHFRPCTPWSRMSGPFQYWDICVTGLVRPPALCCRTGNHIILILNFFHPTALQKLAKGWNWRVAWQNSLMSGPTIGAVGPHESA